MNGDFPPSSREILPAPRGRGSDNPPDLGRAGKGDLVDVRVGHQRLAGPAITGDDIDHAGRQADLLAQLGKAEGCQRGELCRLEHNGVPHRQGGRDFPGQH
jgi:hypothetical protein